MLNPSDSNQRGVLVDLVWLLFMLYMFYSCFGGKSLSCHQAKTPEVVNGARQEQMDQRKNDDEPGFVLPGQKGRREFK